MPRDKTYSQSALPEGEAIDLPEKWIDLVFAIERAAQALSLETGYIRLRDLRPNADYKDRLYVVILESLAQVLPLFDRIGDRADVLAAGPAKVAMSGDGYFVFFEPLVGQSRVLH